MDELALNNNECYMRKPNQTQRVQNARTQHNQVCKHALVVSIIDRALTEASLEEYGKEKVAVTFGGDHGNTPPATM